MYVNWRQGSQFCAELQWVLSCDRAAITSPLHIDGSDLLRLQNLKDNVWLKPWLLPLTLQMHGVSTINGSLHEFLEVALKLNGT